MGLYSIPISQQDLSRQKSPIFNRRRASSVTLARTVPNFGATPQTAASIAALSASPAHNPDQYRYIKNEEQQHRNEQPSHSTRWSFKRLSVVLVTMLLSLLGMEWKQSRYAIQFHFDWWLPLLRFYGIPFERNIKVVKWVHFVLWAFAIKTLDETSIRFLSTVYWFESHTHLISWDFLLKRDEPSSFFHVANCLPKSFPYFE